MARLRFPAFLTKPAIRIVVAGAECDFPTYDDALDWVIVHDARAFKQSRVRIPRWQPFGQWRGVA